MILCTVCNEKDSEWVCVECGKYLCNDCKIKCDGCRDIFCPDCIKIYSIHHTHVCDTCRDVNEHKFVTNDLKNDLIHNMEELAELIQVLSKWARGKPNFKNIKEEISHVEFVINNLKENLEREGK